MSTSLLYHGFGSVGYDHVHSRYQEGAIIFSVKRKRVKIRCSDCRCRDVIPVLKGTRWLLLKNPENLDPEKKEEERLAETLKLNEPLSCAFYLKEDLRQIWIQPRKEIAERVFTDWIKRAQATGIKMLKKFTDTLAGFSRRMILSSERPKLKRLILSYQTIF